MAQDPSGLTQKFGKVLETAKDWINKLPTPGYSSSKTPEWKTAPGDTRPKETMDAFRKAADKRGTTLKSTGTASGGKATKRKRTAKAAGRK